MVEDPGDVWTVDVPGRAITRRFARALDRLGFEGVWPTYWRVRQDGRWLCVWFLERPRGDDVLRGEIGVLDPEVLREAGATVDPPMPVHLSAWSRPFAVVPSPDDPAAASVEAELGGALARAPSGTDDLIERLRSTGPYAARHASHVFALTVLLHQRRRTGDLDELRIALDRPATDGPAGAAPRSRLSAALTLSGLSPLPFENRARLVESVGSRLADLAPVSVRGAAALGPGRPAAVLRKLAGSQSAAHQSTLLLRLCFAPPTEASHQGIRPLLGSASTLVRRRAALALGMLGDESSVETILAIVAEGSPWPLLSPDAVDVADPAFGLLVLCSRAQRRSLADAASAELHRLADRLYGRPRPDIRRYALALSRAR